MKPNFLQMFQPAKDTFYTLFEKAAKNNVEAAKLFAALCRNFKDASKTSKLVHKLEHENDKIVHTIYDELDKVFVTPLDREDIISLATSLDDVIDLIHESTDYLSVYNIQKITPVAKSMSETIVEANIQVAKALPKIRHQKHFSQVIEAVIEINRIENESDVYLREGLKELFKKPTNPFLVLAWHDIYHKMETVSDRLEDIGDVLRRLVTKYG